MSKSYLKIRKGLSFDHQPSAPLDPNEGDIYYNSTLGQLQTYQNGAWVGFPNAGGNPHVIAIDKSSNTLPTTDPYVTDGYTIVDGDTVLFNALSSGNNKVYQASISGSNITWTEKNIFSGGSSLPSKGDVIRIINGSVNELTDYIFDGTNWVLNDNYTVIGTAEDVDYSDGLFTDFTKNTKLGIPIDRFNEILKELTPQPAPILSHIAFDQNGVSAKISWDSFNSIPGYANVDGIGGSSAVSAKGIFDESGQRKGVHQTEMITGRLADTTPQGDGNPTPAYPFYSFGNADKGNLILEVNGSVVHTTDLTTFGSGNSWNVNNSGFSLSAATPIKFPNGNPLNLFKYRTGSYSVGINDQRQGWNYLRINHFFNGTNHYTNYYEWVNDDNAEIMSVSSNHTSTFSMTGSRFISGVIYHTGGNIAYNMTVKNVYKNVYSNSGSAISFTTINGSIPSLPISDWIVDETEDLNLTDQPFTLTDDAILNTGITAGVNVEAPLKADLINGSPYTVPGLLKYQANPRPSTSTEEYFELENIRLQSVANPAVNNYNNQSDIATGTWESNQTLYNSIGLAGYKDGLLYNENSVRSINKGTNGSNFHAIPFSPPSTPDYSSEGGIRFAYIKFQNNTGSTKSNFKIVFNGTSTNFIPITGSLSGNNIKTEIKFPTGSISSGTGWLDCYNDFATGQWNDGDGCRNATAGVGRALDTEWGMTLGTKSIADGEYIILRITANSDHTDWQGYINQISLTWL